MRIMIVDDNRNMRQLVKSILSKQLSHDTEYIECSNGKEALITYNIDRCDYVLMDIQMPEMDGFEATQKIIQIDNYAKIIIMTHYNEPEYADQAYKYRAIGFILKDDLSTLSNLIN